MSLWDEGQTGQHTGGRVPLCRLSALKQTFSFEGAYNGPSCPNYSTRFHRGVERTSGGNRVGMVIINNIKKMLLIISIQWDKEKSHKKNQSRKIYPL